MYESSIDSQAYTIAVWMFADWLGRNPYMVTNAPPDSPPNWSQSRWTQAAQHEEELRLFGSDGEHVLTDDSDTSVVSGKQPEVRSQYVALDDESLGPPVVCEEAPVEVSRYVQGSSTAFRGDDGILRRFPDQLVQLILLRDDSVRLDAVVAMADAMNIVRGIRDDSSATR